MKLVNLKATNKFDVYIGRTCYGYKGSLLANPFKIDSKNDREKVIKDYTKWLLNHYHANDEVWAEVKRLVQLEDEKGEDLILACWCHPQKCHGDIIIQAADWYRVAYDLYNIPVDFS